VERAQQPNRVRHVGVLLNVVQEDPGGPPEVIAFRQGLMELGWIEGRNIDIEFRCPGGDTEPAKTFAKELVGLQPDVLLGRSTPTTAALKHEAGTIPIIFVNVPSSWGLCGASHGVGGILRASPISRRRYGCQRLRAGGRLEAVREDSLFPLPPRGQMAEETPSPRFRCSASVPGLEPPPNHTDVTRHRTTPALTGSSVLTFRHVPSDQSHR
jgi:ABC transporter substrate binding protein